MPAARCRPPPTASPWGSYLMFRQCFTSEDARGAPKGGPTRQRQRRQGGRHAALAGSEAPHGAPSVPGTSALGLGPAPRRGNLQFGAEDRSDWARLVASPIIAPKGQAKWRRRQMKGDSRRVAPSIATWATCS